MKLSFITIVAALVISLTGCERRSAPDATITTAVKDRLAADLGTSAAKIDVDTSSGVVTLSGSVPTTAEKSEAERIAGNIQGVTRVVNNITVERGEDANGGKLSDAAIKADIKYELVANGITDTNVDVRNGEVTIMGEVDSLQEKSRAEEIARQASGVKNVKNRLTIKKKGSGE